MFSIVLTLIIWSLLFPSEFLRLWIYEGLNMVQFYSMLYSFYRPLNCKFFHFSWPFQSSLLSGSSSPSLNLKSYNNLMNFQPLLPAPLISRKTKSRKQKNQVPGIHGWEVTEVGRLVITVNCEAPKTKLILLVFLQNIPGLTQRKRKVDGSPRREERASKVPVEINPQKLQMITSWWMVSYSKLSVVHQVS